MNTYYMNNALIDLSYPTTCLGAFSSSIRMYKADLEDNFACYHMALEEFDRFLETSGFYRDFIEALYDITAYKSTLEYVATEFGVPIIIVKYYLLGLR